MSDAIAETAPRVSRRGALSEMLDRPHVPALAFLIVLIAILGATTTGFLTPANLMSVLQQAAPVAVVALAVNQVVIAGEIDISMGSMVAVLAFVFAGLAKITGTPGRRWRRPWRPAPSSARPTAS